MIPRKTDSLLAAVRVSLARYALGDRPLVVAVSGGADSVALLRLLLECRDSGTSQIVVAHFDHCLRPDSAEDACWVRVLAESHDLTCEIGSPVAAAPQKGKEAWARRERYAFLERIAVRHAAHHVAVAHTADDQAETVLHHILRGTGLRGLQGMPATRRLSDSVRLIRPLLDARRVSLRQYLTDIGQAFRHDESNDDARWTRNSLRNEWIPQLQARFNPRLVETLLTLSEQAGDAARVMQRDAARLLNRSIVEITPQQVRLHAALFAKADPAVVREAAVRLWRRQGWPRQRMTFRHWSAAAELLRGEGPEKTQWPCGLTGRRRGTLVAIERANS
jgi:tRNA(Ile)-lysidine synthase